MNKPESVNASAPAAGSASVEWPTDEGIWMGFIDGGIGWFPMQTMYLRDDLPTREEMAREAAGEVMPPRKVLAIVAQWPESETSWPYTFQGCHPAKQWRRPDEDELRRALIFYGKTPNDKLTDRRDNPKCNLCQTTSKLQAIRRFAPVTC
jgi:hypothetical protein